MHRAVPPFLLALLAAGCTPQNVEVTAGDYTAFLAATNSLTVAREAVNFDEFADYYTVDCREFETARNRAENEALRLPDHLKICENADWPPLHEAWIEQNGYHVVSDPLEPWRGEAVVTSEGDVQLTFHQRLPGGDDFRFAVVIDPNFAPRTCVQKEDGTGVEFQPVDGDWLEHWSEGLPAGTRRYFINSGAYQFNPTDTDGQRWFLPLEWQAAFAQGQFADDTMRARPTRYAKPEAYIRNESAFDENGAVTDEDLLWCEFDLGDDAVESICMENRINQATDISDEVASEMALVGVTAPNGLPSPAPIVEDNRWRVPDGKFAGFDGWTGLNYSWIEFDPGFDLAVGGSATGTFNLFFDGTDSQSRFYVRGTFNVKKFKKDLWTTDFLPPIKLAENNTNLCGVQYGDGADE
ncbi:MAG: hypothetical protein H6733_04460 [Alphaproteobacteria bacterium]|nr:hypothetical protein [Alphaproteobacteria bacterium]